MDFDTVVWCWRHHADLARSAKDHQEGRHVGLTCGFMQTGRAIRTRLMGTNTRISGYWSGTGSEKVLMKDFT